MSKYKKILLELVLGIIPKQVPHLSSYLTLLIPLHNIQMLKCYLVSKYYGQKISIF